MKKNLILFFVVCLSGCKTINYPDDARSHEDLYPTWSPNGKAIAYWHSSENGGDPTGLYVIGSDGQNKQLLQRGNAWSPDWAPDGKKIAFSDGDEIYAIAVDGGNLSRITAADEPVTSPAWSPDGNRIAYVGLRGPIGPIWIMNIGGSAIKFSDGLAPDWSPNGNRLVFSLDGIYAADASGAGIVKLANTSSRFFSFRNSWSPNGLLIAFQKTFSGLEDSEIWTVRSDGTNPKKLTEGRYPAFSPDAEHIAFTKFIGGSKFVVMALKLDGTELRQITN